jgi:predicted peptidase
MNTRFARRLVTFHLAAFFLISAPICFGQKYETGFLDRTLTVGGVEYRYQVYVPRGFNKKQKWPMIVALHGGGEYGSDGMRHTNVGLAPAIRRNPEQFPAIVIFPQAKADGKPGWQLDGGAATMAAIDRAVKEFSGDTKRVVLTGYSAGGNGTWSLASRYPEKFAAIVPVCAFVSRFTGRASAIDYPALAPGDDPHAEIAKKVVKLPIWMFHGAKDDVVLPDESRKMFDALKKLGANVQYTELPNANHNAWDPAYGNEDLVKWMLAQRRP